VGIFPQELKNKIHYLAGGAALGLAIAIFLWLWLFY
jgi:hypothetical protein